MTHSPDAIDYKSSKSSLYSGEIKIRKHLYMRVTGEYIEHMIEFYHMGANGKKRVLYLTKLTYMSQKLFNQILTAIEVEQNPSYIEKFPQIMAILGMIHI